jgi:cyclophilin family peptidyl-prolyl cis-trans isomerase
MKKLAYILFALVILTGCKNEYANLENGVYADMQTDQGKILLKLYHRDVPVTVANFVSLAEGNNPNVVDSLANKPYYNKLGFHRVVLDFMIQGGDPQGDGMGGPGYTFFDEFPRDSLGNLIYKHDSPGVLSMANLGANTNGSQFFITHKATPWLDGIHTIFGEVITGMQAVDSIKQYDVIQSVKIVRIGEEAESFDAPKIFAEGTAAYFIEIEEKRKKLEADRKLFLENLKKQKEEAKLTESGLKILTLKEGDKKGKKFNRAQMAYIHYSIRVEEGGKLIQSTEGDQPFGFILDQRPMITGVTEAITNMREGDKARLFVPYYLAYGESGYGPIPPKADIVFDLELLKVGE